MRAWIASALISLGMGQAAGVPSPSADYWRLLPHYRPQITDSACSVASVAMALAALGHDGVSLAGLLRHLNAALRDAGMHDTAVETFLPTGRDADTLAHLRAILSAAAGQDGDVVLVTFDQDWLWGEPSVGHVSPVGDYDAATGQVLIMDVDGAHFGPVWVHEAVLLAAMTRAGGDDPDGAILIRRSSRGSGTTPTK